MSNIAQTASQRAHMLHSGKIGAEVRELLRVLIAEDELMIANGDVPYR